jgi:hypothetical protein
MAALPGSLHLAARQHRLQLSHAEIDLRVFVRDGGTWQVAAFHNTMIAPFASPRR